MKTTVKEDLGYTPFTVHDLENEAEITALIKEAEAVLMPCPCCGREHPVICYSYQPDLRFPHSVLHNEDTNRAELVMTCNPHVLYAECPRPHQMPISVDKGCGIRTQKWHALDDEADFKEALRLIIEAWNRRPN